MSRLLDQTFREAGGRVTAALAARFRDLDLAEDALSEAMARAAERWGDDPPGDPAAWLYAVASRCALDRIRRRTTASTHAPDPPSPPSTPEEDVMRLDDPIPDERLRLIFVCCHPALAPEARAPLTLKVVCGLSTAEIARAFLLPEPTLAQRLVRAKRKIAAAGVPFDVPGPGHWPERMDAVLSTLEVAYAQAHADAALAGPHADFAREILTLSGVLATLTPDESEVLALAATIRFAEARRPARLGPDGAMTPLSEQDPQDWDEALNAQAETLLARSVHLSRRSQRQPGSRALQAAVHAAHASRRRTGATPWADIVGLYDALSALRPDPVVAVNRAVAVGEAYGPQAGLAALEGAGQPDWLPFQAALADLLRRAGDAAGSTRAYRAALAMKPAPAEALLLSKRLRTITGQGSGPGPKPFA